MQGIFVVKLFHYSIRTGAHTSHLLLNAQEETQPTEIHVVYRTVWFWMEQF